MLTSSGIKTGAGGGTGAIGIWALGRGEAITATMRIAKKAKTLHD